MEVTIVGSGYVGLVAGACLAETGNTVRCVDVDAGKIERLRRNEIPIYEPGLEPMVASNQAAGRLRFTTDLASSVRESQVIFIAVGTPPGEDGSADLQHVIAVAEGIGPSARQAWCAPRLRDSRRMKRRSAPTPSS
jgi:UDPglucose 6-dehydrogenase